MGLLESALHREHFHAESLKAVQTLLRPRLAHRGRPTGYPTFGSRRRRRRSRRRRRLIENSSGRPGIGRCPADRAPRRCRPQRELQPGRRGSGSICGTGSRAIALSCSRKVCGGRPGRAARCSNWRAARRVKTSTTLQSPRWEIQLIPVPPSSAAATGPSGSACCGNPSCPTELRPATLRPPSATGLLAGRADAPRSTNAVGPALAELRRHQPTLYLPVAFDPDARRVVCTPRSRPTRESARQGGRGFQPDYDVAAGSGRRGKCR